MQKTQLNRGQQKRVMYVENKVAPFDGAHGHIGWVTFSRSGQTVYYRDKTLQKSGGQGIAGNFFDVETGEEYWVSGIKKNGQDAHRHEPVQVVIDEDAREEYRKILKD